MGIMGLIVWMSAVNTAGVLENVTAKQESVGVAVKLDGRNQHVKQVRDITLIIRNINMRNLKVMLFFVVKAVPQYYTWSVLTNIRYMTHHCLFKNK